jgi:hypothetical protein
MQAAKLAAARGVGGTDCPISDRMGLSALAAPLGVDGK